MATHCPKCKAENPDTQSFCGDCGTQLIPLKDIPAQTRTLVTPPQELSRGTTIAGRYEIIEQLGTGGMGSVYRVEDTKIHEDVAIKLIKPEIVADKKTIERFRNELKLARKIRHKNVCQMFDLGEAEGTHFITMEYVQGEDLKSFMRRAKQLSIPTVISIAKQICGGLEEAHKLGIVHRDLKPSNIMIDKDGNVHIMDFGIARSMKTEGITGTGVMIGTPEYMSPEQVESKEVDQLSDLYSLGVVLYEMVTGRVPFEAETPLAIAMKHKSEAPKNPKELNTQIPEDLCHVILKCLEKNREQRYQSAEELHSELSKIEKGIPTTEKIVPERKPTIRWKGLLLYSAVVVVLLSVILTGIFLLTGRQKALNSVAVLPLKTISDDPKQVIFADGMTEAIINELAKIRALLPISAQSVMQYKGSTKPMPVIARELNVDAIVEGTVLHAEQRVRITVRLIEGKKDRLLWSDVYESELRDVMGLQSEVARAIADEIKIAITPEEEVRLQSASIVNPEAYEAYLMGKNLLIDWHEERLRKAIDHFERACKIDPDFALGYAGLAEAYAWLGSGAVLPPEDIWPKARLAAEKALEIDEGLSEAHTILAWEKFQYEFEWHEAEKEFKHALELSPNNSTARNVYSFFLGSMEQFEEALTQIRLARKLDPLSLSIQHNEVEILSKAGHYDESQQLGRNLIDSHPEYPEGHHSLARSYSEQGMYEEAITLLHTAIKLFGDNDDYRISILGYLYGRLGRKAEARLMIDKLNEMTLEKKYVSPVHKAWVYIGLDEKDKAFELLEKGYETHASWMPYLKKDYFYDTIRSDPRFKALLKKMNLG